MATQMTLNVNGKAQVVTVDDPQMPLLYALRNDLGLHGPRYGCAASANAAPALRISTGRQCSTATALMA